jgi:hypothetical protein
MRGSLGPWVVDNRLGLSARVCSEARRRVKGRVGSRASSWRVRAVARYLRDSPTLPDAPIGWPVVPREAAGPIDRILENLGLNWWAVLGLNQ